MPQHHNSHFFYFARNSDLFFLSSQPYLYTVIGRIFYLGDNVLILVYATTLDENLSTSSQFLKLTSVRKSYMTIFILHIGFRLHSTRKKKGENYLYMHGILKMFRSLNIACNMLTQIQMFYSSDYRTKILYQLSIMMVLGLY